MFLFFGRPTLGHGGVYQGTGSRRLLAESPQHCYHSANPECALCPPACPLNRSLDTSVTATCSRSTA